MKTSLRRLRDLLHDQSKSEAAKDRTLELEILEERQLLAVFTVNNTADNLDEDGMVTLREALQAANTNDAVNADVGAGDVTGDTIIFDSTVFGGGATITLADVMGFGDFEITDDLVIDGISGSGGGSTDVTLDGNNFNRIFDINSGANGPVTLIGMTLQNGNGADIDSTDANDGRGGAIYNEQTDLTIDGTTITGNTASGPDADDGGGGVYNLGGNLTVTDGIISNNVANGTLGSGGGIFQNGGSLAVNSGSLSTNNANRAGGGIEVRSTEGSANVVLNDAILTSNFAGINGGGLHVTAPTGGGPTSVRILGGSVNGNDALQEGGGLWNDANGTMTINGTVINGNTAFGNNAANDAQGGGGVFNNGGAVSITNATIVSNVVQGGSAGADDGGGGIFNDGRNNANATISITNTRIASNLVLSTSLNGGGILNIGTAGNNATVDVIGGSIGANRAARAGGGIETNNGVVNLNGVSVLSNSAGVNGGGLHVTGADTTTIDGGLFQGNSAGQEGGGLWNSATGTMTINGTDVSFNTAFIANSANDAQGGGGIFNNGGGLSIDNATILNNQVIGDTDAGADDGGGGLFNDGRNSTTATMTITNTRIESNSVLTTSLNGGGILNIGAAGNDATLNVTGGIIVKNRAARAGGGIETNNGVVNLTSASIGGNSAGVNGGGLHATGADVVTVTRGEVDFNTAGQEGGGLWNSGGGTMTINATTIASNTALAGNSADAQGGGGVFNNGGGLSISDSLISSNTVMGALDPTDGGAGVFNDGRNTSGASVTITNTTIINNEVINTGSGGGRGGGVLNIGSTSIGIANTVLNITSSTISGNSAPQAGGGVETNSATLNVSNVNIETNSVGVNGGGIHVQGADVTTITDGRIANNLAAQEGGGVWNSATGTMSIDGTLIMGNTALAGNSIDAQGGGGVFNNGGSIGIQNAAITANYVIGDLDATDGGGGVFNDGRITGTATVSISNTTITQNEAVDTNPSPLGGRGGGILNLGSASAGVANTVLNVTDSTIEENLADQAGAGIETNAGTVNLNNVALSINRVGVNGGGLHVAAADVVNILGGTVSGNTALQEGGGLWNSSTGTMSVDGTLIIGNSAFASNSADAQGGGGVFNNGGTLAIQNATISYNAVIGDLSSTDGGGGIFNDGRNTDGATVSISNSMIVNNDVINTGTLPLAGRGGGILNTADNGNTATVTVTGSTIAANSAAQAGGGIENQILDNGTVGLTNASVSLDNVTLDGNVTFNNGGAVHLGAIGSAGGTLGLDATNTTFSNNQAGNEGGGVWNESLSGSVVTIDHSTLHGNSAPFGGALFQNGSTGTITLANSTLSNNIAGVGGALATESGASSVGVLNSTIVNNVGTSSGGGLALGGGSITINNSIVGNNSAPTGPDVVGDVSEANFSIFSDTSDMSIGVSNSNFLNVDPRLGPLQDNGGSTLTHAPLSGSPANQSGDPGFTSTLTDQRGLDRVRGGRLDIGAVEGPAHTVKLAGNGSGMAAQIRIFDPQTNVLIDTITPFGGFVGAVRTASADINNDGVLDIVVAAGPNADARVKVFDGATGALLHNFIAYDNFFGGVFVAAGDVNGDGVDDIITGPGSNAGPHVKVFDGTSGAVIRSFFAYSTSFHGGVRVASGDVNGDGRDDIFTGTGPGAGRVKVFDGVNGSTLLNFLPYGTGFTQGIFVASADFSGDGFADVVTGAGPGAAQPVRVFDGFDPQVTLANFFAFSQNFTGGLRVAAADADDGGTPDILVGTGAGIPAQIRRFDGQTLTVIDNTLPFGTSYTGGVFVSGTGVVSGGGSPLHASTQIVNSSAAGITAADVAAIQTEVLARFAQAGLPESSQLALAAVEVTIGNLSGSLLGVTSGGTITLDTNAAGHGWYVDADTTTDDEFTENRDLVEGRVDLMTALFHEYGHILGLEDLDSLADEVMSETLDPGVRISTYAEIVDRLLHQEEEEDE